jgi:cysteinyl-tRNA synthetase
VTYVRNITDIDDKIIKRAIENGETIQQLTDRFIAAMHEDADALGVLRPDHEPRATDFVPEMQDLIGKLESSGLAYQAADGDVNYAVRKFPGYGKLSGKSLDDLRAGERVEVDSAKQDPLDFVLWKHAKPGEPAWESPWGEGRPGWHIECSAMSSKLLGKHFDIHGGGQDLQFPHHENEIAQSEGAQLLLLRQLLDAQRLRPRRQREDVEVAGQLLHHPRGARNSTMPRWCASSSCAPITAAR